MRLKIIILFLVSLPGFCLAAPDDRINDRIEADTTVRREDLERSSEFYDRLKDKSDNSAFARMLYRALVSSGNRRDTTDPDSTRLVRDTEYFSPYRGEKINNVLVFRNNVFENADPDRKLLSLGNSLHVVTRESVIRRNLLFDEGDRVDPDIMARNEQILRSMDYLADAYIAIAPDTGSEGVNIYVFMRDAWTITVEAKSSRLSHYYLSLIDDNILGTGNSLTLRTYYSWKHTFLGGEVLEYHMPNIRGSFFTLDLIAGQGYDEYFYGGKIAKEFILPNDYMLGAQVQEFKEYERQVMEDTVLLIKYRNFDGWAGKSWPLLGGKNNFFVTTGYQNMKFGRRPEVVVDTNTYYHDRQTYLAGFGIYRESYYRGNMIYSYGATEDIPYGQKVEFTSGYYNGEFGNKWYSAVTGAIGRRTPFGYFRAQGTYSTFINDSRNKMQRAFDVNLTGFSNLMQVSRSYIRQFFTLDYTHGFNRLYGEGETLIFREKDTPRGYRYNYEYGKVRLVLNTETVLFTPLYFYGFRFAFYGFADFGWLGDSNFVFGNDFFSSVGLGLRLKNERLVFSAIQFRLGVGFGSKGFEDRYKYFSYNYQSRLRMAGFKPEAPRLYDYR